MCMEVRGSRFPPFTVLAQLRLSGSVANASFTEPSHWLQGFLYTYCPSHIFVVVFFVIPWLAFVSDLAFDF